MASQPLLLFRLHKAPITREKCQLRHSILPLLPEPSFEQWLGSETRSRQQ